MGIEGGHYYHRDGLPCYLVKKKGGGMRAVNLRWDRALKLVPSVTTVTKIVAKPQLTNWMVMQGILAALTLPRESGENDEGFVKRIREDSKAQAAKAAEDGSRIHNALERSYKGEPFDPKYTRHAAAVRGEIKRLFPNVDDWVSEKSFAHPMGFGGRVDLHSPSTGVVIDFKGKDGDFADGKKLHWDQHWQLAPYQVGLGLSPQKAANIFFSRTHPDAVASYVWSESDLHEGWEIFQKTLALWKQLKSYESGF